MKNRFSVSFTTTVSSILSLSAVPLLIGGLSLPGLAAVETATIEGRPITENDRVTLRISSRDQDDRPVVELNPSDFQLLVDGDPLEFNPRDWKSPRQAVPPPSWIIVLLDMSGSMNKQDSRGTQKLEGALKAIREFRDSLADISTNVPYENIPQVAIVPFGVGGGNCPGFEVDNAALDKFFPVTDFKLVNHLDYLGQQSLCAATNLYSPLSRAIRFLGDEKDSRFYPDPNSGRAEPRLSIILLSDGYHSIGQEEKDFQSLMDLLERYPQITIHTLGYGQTPEQLGNQYNLNRPATRADLWTGKHEDLPAQKVPADEFVDQERLAMIAQTTGGIDEFSGDAQTIAERLELFINALLGEYEISYIQPNPIRGKTYQVEVVIDDGTAQVKSAPAFYSQLFYTPLPLASRAKMVVLLLLLTGLAGALPFHLWAQKLRRK
jgi:hypothetical protein